MPAIARPAPRPVRTGRRVSLARLRVPLLAMIACAAVLGLALRFPAPALGPRVVTAGSAAGMLALLGWGFVRFDEQRRRRHRIARRLARTQARHGPREMLGTVGAWFLERDTNRIWWNEPAAQVLDARDGADAVPLERFLRGLSDADRQRWRDGHRRALRDGRTVRIEFRYRRSGGERAWLRSVARPHRDRRGRIDGLSGTIQDVSALRALGRQLESTEARLHDLSALVADWTFETEADGSVLHLSDGIVVRLGNWAARCAGRPLWTFGGHARAGAAAGRLREAIAGGHEIHGVHLPVVGPDGQGHLVAFHARATRDAHGRLRGYRGFARVDTGDALERRAAGFEQRIGRWLLDGTAAPAATRRVEAVLRALVESLHWQAAGVAVADGAGHPRGPADTVHPDAIAGIDPDAAVTLRRIGWRVQPQEQDDAAPTVGALPVAWRCDDASAESVALAGHVAQLAAPVHDAVPRPSAALRAVLDPAAGVVVLPLPGGFGQRPGVVIGCTDGLPYDAAWLRRIAQALTAALAWASRDVPDGAAVPPAAAHGHASHVGHDGFGARAAPHRADRADAHDGPRGSNRPARIDGPGGLHRDDRPDPCHLRRDVDGHDECDGRNEREESDGRGERDASGPPGRGVALFTPVLRLAERAIVGVDVDVAFDADADADTGAQPHAVTTATHTAAASGPATGARRAVWLHAMRAALDELAAPVAAGRARWGVPGERGPGVNLRLPDAIGIDPSLVDALTGLRGAITALDAPLRVVLPGDTACRDGAPIGPVVQALARAGIGVDVDIGPDAAPLQWAQKLRAAGIDAVRVRADPAAAHAALQAGLRVTGTGLADAAALRAMSDAGLHDLQGPAVCETLSAAELLELLDTLPTVRALYG